MNNLIKLDLNEYDFKHPSSFYETLNEHIIQTNTVTHYTSITSDTTKTLINKIALHNSINNENIILTSGSDNALDYITHTFINKNSKLFIFYPSYVIFEMMARRSTSNVEYININISDNNYNIDNYLHKYFLDNNSVIYITNPCNPIGNIININSLEDCLNKYSKTIFIIDEAYIEFNEENTCIKLINKYDNLIITRSFSKGYGLAGLRVGYIATSVNLYKFIIKTYNERSLTEISKVMALYVMNNINHYKSIINIIINERELFQEFLKQNNIYYINSNSNFVLFHVGNKYDDLIKKLEKNNIIIRNKNNEVKGFVRITIGNPENMTTVKKYLKQFIYLFENYIPLHE
jgi:histidinol-phosphate aminotransferase